jgi:hypothetical protein
MNRLGAAATGANEQPAEQELSSMDAVEGIEEMAPTLTLALPNETVTLALPNETVARRARLMSAGWL